MPRVLYVYLSPSSFVLDDLALLRERYEVRTFHFDAKAAKGALGMARMLARQAAWLRRELPGTDLVYGWFADYHMALPVRRARRWGVPVAVALGGFESNVLPGLGYGVMTSRWRAPLARDVLRRASLLLPVSASLLEAENRFGAFPKVLRNGVRARVPGLATPAAVIPTGYDADAWPMGPKHRPPSVLTVAFADRERAVRLKGLDLFVEVARRLPEVPFRAIGVSKGVAQALKAQGMPPNVRLDGPVPREALAEAYGEASVFALLSRSEGLPNVLCEAMLCGAVPVGSAVGGIPDGIGETGFVAPTPDPDALAGLVKQALAEADGRRKAARNRIVAHFSRAQRRQRLFAALDGLMR
ncbi:MAG TPA: glycosyltransferase family 4 protein [Rhodothermales bacterium]|nr:glycosyltransferase family 4 protein [Rhodothermales bacterium]